ncbi:hypothetical protein Leryth_001553 [Lithospermum erythrorhizon]|nr:hypothetical protein Leryth_001553 [Lithospermum erythrorhizon]
MADEEYDQQASNNKRKWPSLDQINELLASQENRKKNNPIFKSSVTSSSSTSTDKEFGKSIAPMEDEPATHDGVIKVDPKPNRTSKSEIIDKIAHLVVSLQFGTIETSLRLKGNFAPVRNETPPTGDLEVVQGQIPKLLTGMMIRNGPNPNQDPVANYSWMDGDRFSLYFYQLLYFYLQSIFAYIYHFLISWNHINI